MLPRINMSAEKTEEKRKSAKTKLFHFKLIGTTCETVHKIIMNRLAVVPVHLIEKVARTDSMASTHHRNAK